MSVNDLSPRASEAPRDHPTSARRRSLALVSGIAVLLLLLWLGDALSGFTSRASKHTTTQQAGAFAVTLTLTPVQPKAGSPFQAQVRIVGAHGQPVTDGQVSYSWAMVTMDMGTATGNALRSAVPGTYAMALGTPMGGYWRLTITIHTPNQADGTTAFAIAIQG